MSQLDIYNYLKKESPNKFSAKELMFTLNLKEQIVFNNLRRLVKHGDILKEKNKYYIE